MDIETIRKLATRFRKAIEASDRAALGITFGSFPTGSCGDAAPLLGTYLTNHGAGEFTYVYGSRGEGDDWSSHGWLEGESLIIDITADQFADALGPVIVTASSPFHRSFSRDGENRGDLRAYDPQTQAELGRIYAVILRQLGEAP